ncbi:EamA family transporter [Saccharopolyspora erythraea]|uniref:EamA family transporter n=1 Tax=Saccharopolyspora erythraea TaxID=1836 RepID=UPI0020126276|nr:EamA family transporter [Saccharopolyspora erythraea]
MQSPPASTGQGRAHRGLPPSLLVLGSVCSVQFGQAWGKHLFGVVGPAGVVALRLGLAAAVLLALWRPRIPAGWRTRALIAGFGTAIAAMNIIYPALGYLPLGVAVSLQLLGPFTVALAGSRRPRDAIWALLSGAGVLLLCAPSGPAPPLAGVGLALLSAAGMGGYLLLSRRAGELAADGAPLALAVTWAAVLALPFGIAESGTALLSTAALLPGLGVALLSAVVPYSLELVALRRLTPRVVGVLQSLEPAVGAAAGLLLLSEVLADRQIAGLCCVTLASAGAVLTRERG